MPLKNKEDRAAYNKVYREKNKERDKEKIKARNKVRYEKNKVKINAQNKAHSKTPSGIKTNTLNNWKTRGLIGDLSKIYDERYLHCTHCEICNKEFNSTRDRCLDHDHETGLFRKILCQNCNSHDNWKKYI